MKAILSTPVLYDRAAVKTLIQPKLVGDEMSFAAIRAACGKNKSELPDGHIHQALLDLNIRVVDE